MTGPHQLRANNEPEREISQIDVPSLDSIDYQAFANDVQALHAKLKADLGDSDIAHLRKMERWGRTCTVLAMPLLGWFLIQSLRCSLALAT